MWRRFLLTLWVVGVAYMLALLSLSAIADAPRLIDVWWWTAIPVAWIGAAFLHFRRRNKRQVLSSLVGWARQYPGYATLLAGAVPILAIFCLLSTPSSDGPSPSEMMWLEIATGGLVVVAVGVGLTARARARRTSR